MREVHLFCEDQGHEEVIVALLKRLAKESGLEVTIKRFRVRGGHGRVLFDLKRYVDDLQTGGVPTPSAIVVGYDANCKGVATAREAVLETVGPYEDLVICAIPDPHVERWLLLDSAAFKRVLGRGCEAPDQKCEKGRYKQLLIQAIRDAGEIPLIGGIEYAEDIVEEMNLDRMRTVDKKSLGSLIDDLRSLFRRWQEEEGA